MVTTNDNHKYEFDLWKDTPQLTIKTSNANVRCDLLALYFWISDRQDECETKINAAATDTERSQLWLEHLQSFRDFVCSETNVPHTSISARQINELYYYVIKCGNDYYEEQRKEVEESKKSSGESQWTVYSQDSTQESPTTTETGTTQPNGIGSETSGS